MTNHMNFPISHWPMILNAALKDTQAQRGETTLTKQNFLGCPIELRKKKSQSFVHAYGK